MLRQLDRDLWVAEQPLRFVGLEIGARMTVVRLPDGRLVVHSPIGYTDELGREVAGLGTARWIVAPNRLHHLFVTAWHDASPGSLVLVAPGLGEKRPDLAGADTLAAGAPGEWGDAIDVLPIEGFPFANECVFFHRPSATLIASDLAFNLGDDCPALTRLVMRFSGRLGELAPTLIERALIRDRAAFRGSLERVLEWPFERVIVAHGDVVETGGREALAKGYDWLLGATR